MKKHIFLFLFSLLFAGTVFSQQISVVPKPLSSIAGSGEFIFSSQTTFSYPAYQGDSIKKIVDQFVLNLTHVTGFNASIVSESADASVKLTLNNTLAPEEYKLNVTATAITIDAATPSGFFYAFQTIKQLMPVEIAAGVQNPQITKWAVPAVTVNDKPRFGWRGFMLDVGRHFFDKEQVKRVIDIMATYKLNRFHWHLTEDQGWRVEIKKYPKLTSVGSQRKYSQIWGHPDGVYYDYIPYGPFFYTQDEIREVVAYARERFIEIIPEVDMPGHFQAALAAYPEYSCTPNSKHEVWTDYGVSGDVLNVGNPEALTFVKDILDEIITLFPFKYIHIGGDECPTNAWRNNAQCQALLASLNSTNYRDLQTYFFKEIEKHLNAKENPADRRKVIAWNETLDGDLTGSNVTIMAWTGAANASKIAAGKGLDVIMTPQIPFYINRKQSSDPAEPFSQGSGSETLEVVYNHEPVPTDATSAMLPYYKGVQACFWTEHVEHGWHVEYLMLPRIAAVAETGWSPKTSKNFNDFVTRIRKDTTLYNLKGWSYGKHYMRDKTKVMPQVSDNNATHWFRIVTAAGDATRSGKCFELLGEGSPLLTTYSTAAVNRLWSNAPADETDRAYTYQWWCLKENPAQKGVYALVNKALPSGSLNPVATAASNAGRWTYDPANLHYSFVLGEKYQESGNSKFYSVRSTNYTSLYLNFALGGQQNAINLWADPLDGNGGMMAFVPFLETETKALIATLREMNKYLEYPAYETGETDAPGAYSKDKQNAMRAVMMSESQVYNLKNVSEIDSVQQLYSTYLTDVKNSLAYPLKDGLYYIESAKYPGARLYQGGDNKLRYRTGVENDSAVWRVASTAAISGTFARTIQLRNKATDYCIGANDPVELQTGVFLYKTEFSFDNQDWELSGYSVGNSTRIFPMPWLALQNPGTIARNGMRVHGTGWTFVPASTTSNTQKLNADHLQVYLVNKRILLKNSNTQVSVFSVNGCEIPYRPEREFLPGVYVVRSGAQSVKVVIN
ncbi:MAG: hypothetical protein EOM47_00415 [Bacteroidia bacterium]|nr:hypothetical protein [Bacteroidia bacterium]